MYSGLLPILLLSAVLLVSWTSAEERLLEKRSICHSSPCFKPLPPPKRRVVWKRSADEETTVIQSDLPTEKLLEHVKSKYVLPDEQAEIVEDNTKAAGGTRPTRAVRVVVIKVCNRRTRICRVIVIHKRV